LVPFFLFGATRGGKKYIPTLNFSLPKKYHIPTILWSALFLMLGSTLLKLALVSGKYTEFPLYNAFFAHRNGNVFNDIYLVFAFCIIPPVLEGLIFRGSLLREHDKRGRMTATVFSSLFFALLDFDFELLIPKFFIGVVLCIVLYATDSIATTIALHVIYNFFAVFVEPTFISIKNVSSNVELFTFIVAILTLIIAFFLFSHLSRLYRKYSHDKFGDNFIRSTPRERTFWHLVELFTSIPAIACYVLYVIITLILNR
jgi:membrane protease YdiL (CAAX protease family)